MTATFTFGSNQSLPFLAEAGEEKNVRCHMVVENTRSQSHLKYPLRVQNSSRGILGKGGASLEFRRVDADRVREMYEMVKVSFSFFFFNTYISLTGLGVVHDRNHVDRLHYLFTMLLFISTLVVIHCGQNIFLYAIDFWLGHIILANEMRMDITACQFWAEAFKRHHMLPHTPLELLTSAMRRACPRYPLCLQPRARDEC